METTPTTTTIPTPPASSAAPSTHTNPLPQPRRTPLKGGSPKETQLITFLDHSIHKEIWRKVESRVVNRKGVIKHAGIGEGISGERDGYRSFNQVVKDVSDVVDVVWVSGSPTLQTPYLLTLSTLLIDALPLFPPAPTPTFTLLEKLDAAFSSLLSGQDIDTGAPLPGFEHGHHPLSVTDKVRIKGIVERMRVTVFKAVVERADRDGGRDVEEEEEDGGAGDDRAESEGKGDADGMVVFEGFENDDDEVRMDVDGADEQEEADEEDDVERLADRVFERTLAELGDVLGGDPIGIITED